MFSHVFYCCNSQLQTSALHTHLWVFSLHKFRSEGCQWELSVLLVLPAPVLESCPGWLALPSRSGCCALCLRPTLALQLSSCRAAALVGADLRCGHVVRSLADCSVKRWTTDCDFIPSLLMSAAFAAVVNSVLVTLSYVDSHKTGLGLLPTACAKHVQLYH